MAYVSPYFKAKDNKLAREEQMILKAKYQPTERVVFKGRVWDIKYAEVRDNELHYLAIWTDKALWLPERLIA